MVKKLLPIVALTALYPSLAPSAEPAPRFSSFPVGKAEVVAFQDARWRWAPPCSRTPIPPLLKRTTPQGQAPAPVNAFLVKTGGTIILVDTGHGPTGPGGHLLASLAAASLDPPAIDLVVLTHALSDHTGGLLKDGAKAFPKAKIAFSRAEPPPSATPASSKLPDQFRPYFMPAHAALKACEDRVGSFRPATLSPTASPWWTSLVTRPGASASSSSPGRAGCS